MFNFYKSKNENFEEVFEMNNKITNHLIKNKILSISEIDKYKLPYSMEEIIPRIENMAGDARLITDVISNVLDIESFLSINKENINENTLIGRDYVVVDSIYFTTNPLSNYIEKLKENIQKYNEEEILIAKIGYISTHEFEKVITKSKNNLMKDKKDIYLSNLKIELIFAQILTDGMKKDAKNIRINMRDGYLFASYNIENQLIEFKNIRCSISEYAKLTGYIISIFNKKPIFEEQNNKMFKLSLVVNNSTERDNTIKILNIKLSNQYKENLSISDLKLPIFDKKIFENKIMLPTGLLIVSSKTNLKESYYSAIEQQLKIKPDKKVYSIERYIEKIISNTIQLEYVDEIKNLDTSDYSIVAFDNIETKEDMDYIIKLVNKGTFVILGVEANNSIEAFSFIQKIVNNKEIFSDNLLGFLHLDKVPKICQFCAKKISFINSNNYQDFSMLDNSPKMNDIIKIENVRGCDNCTKGYSGFDNVYEYLDNDAILKDNILNSFNIRSLRIEKTSTSWKNIYETSARLISGGITSPNGVINSIGIPKKK